jgi:hypothetical protein
MSCQECGYSSSFTDEKDWCLLSCTIGQIDKQAGYSDYRYTILFPKQLTGFHKEKNSGKSIRLANKNSLSDSMNPTRVTKKSHLL